jgi:hypothetical protein
MPIVDDFKLFLQGKQIRSAKESVQPVVEFGSGNFPNERLEELEKRIFCAGA